MTVLDITGEVRQPQRMDFLQLCELSGQIKDLGDVMPGRKGSGVPLREILAAADPGEKATHITLESTDGGFSASAPLKDLENGIVAYRLGEDPLPRDLGGPFRFFVPEAGACDSGAVDACANVKFLGILRLTVGPGRDTRPTNAAEHEDLHRLES